MPTQSPPDMQAMLDNFLALKTSDRRKTVNAILNALTVDEKRDLKRKMDNVTFQVDIWGSLPPELRDLVVKDLNLHDLFVLRRVSKLWNKTLSSPSVLRSAYMYATITGKHVLDTLPAEHVERWIKRRTKAEQGRPFAVGKLLVSPDHLDTEDEQMSYANGMFAWVDTGTDKSSICLVHLTTGEKRHFTTDNRETLGNIHVSDTLVAAISMRGYCHVWEIMTGTHQSFRLTSLSFHHFLTHGVKVMISYEDNIIHFCFATGIARTFAIEGLICSASLHKSDDEVSLICIRDKTGHGPELSKADYHLQVEKYTVDTNVFIRTWSRYEELPFQDGVYRRLGPDETLRAYQGQVSSMLYPYERTNPRLYLSLTDSDQIAVHRMPVLPGHIEDMDVAWFDQGMAFFTQLQFGGTRHVNIGVGRESLSSPSSSGTLSYELTLARLLPHPPQLDSVHRIWAGDGFFLYLGHSEVWVWCFDEDWNPSGALSLAS
ncbi:hypothetical protein N7522_008120 [Penicillium canescens]|uniref:F-box domain-containing protein n=1 Tax=Penicillium canescens TaxID=5083 RepID=A0AAD6IF15_PENCN|nr:uncharacterized protein N7446_002914 [Penicillium canescens]KAJ5996460.1 hypothetical protein N7522_008120 [Penicillium canescens]KAJ6044720.1 hypothetical protein N7460_006075 [Penicillium canescens]KAJ6056189.1 hypothetical protein N7444_005287 [Penicillium canescens]KAJ6075137.1 hypothetical protein N7446_002914 [Penicillium canescens]